MNTVMFDVFPAALSYPASLKPLTEINLILKKRLEVCHPKIIKMTKTIKNGITHN
jgi:hypothetical protein